ncbi:MAG: glycerophosphodiester phosphodiesterase [Elusimicrobiota bacterium]
MLSIGHRGFKGLCLENTLESFGKAIALKADMIEFDIRRCRTGEIFVIHDRGLKRVSGIDKSIRHSDYNTIKKITLKNGEKLLTLEEVLSFINKRVMVNIEIKEKGLEKDVADIINKYVKKYKWNRKNIIVSSFNISCLRNFRRLDKYAKIGILKKSFNKKSLDIAHEIKAYSMHLNLRSVTKKIVDICHNNGLKVLVWTVNKPLEKDRLQSWKTDGIFSDIPLI